MHIVEYENVVASSILQVNRLQPREMSQYSAIHIDPSCPGQCRDARESLLPGLAVDTETQKSEFGETGHSGFP
jgi:hypothetical protein